MRRLDLEEAFTRARSARRPETPEVAITALCLTKAADVLTTIGGLLLVSGLTESNPTARAVLNVAGAPGLIVAGVAAIVLVVATVEWGARTVGVDGDVDDRGRLLLYAGSYYPLSLIYLGAAVHNLLLIEAAL